MPRAASLIPAAARGFAGITGLRPNWACSGDQGHSLLPGSLILWRMYLRHNDSQEGRQGRSLLVAGAQRPVGRRVIQQTVAQLAELDERGCVEARALATRLIGGPEQSPLFEDVPAI